MTEIFICGDTHGHFDHVIEAAQKHRPAAMLFVGDVTGSGPAIRPLHEDLAPVLELGIDVWWIAGNHDTDSEDQYDALFESKLGDKDLHGRVVEIAGIRVAGLGGIFREEVWQPPQEPQYQSAREYIRRGGKEAKWRSGLVLRHRSTIFPDVYERLSTLRADLLITHEAPSYHPFGIDEIRKLAIAMRVKRSFHGHHHDRLDYEWYADKDGFQAFGIGYCGILDMHGGVIRPGDFDEERHNWRQKHVSP